eukprot:350951-Chlamydomonas_euryale.AAC.3
MCFRVPGSPTPTPRRRDQVCARAKSTQIAGAAVRSALLCQASAEVAPVACTPSNLYAYMPALQSICPRCNLYALLAT